MVDTVTFADVTTSSTQLSNASGYNLPTVTRDGKTLPHWLAVLWSAVLACGDQVAAAGVALVATSESEVAVGAGEKSFAIGTSKGFSTGSFVLAARTADPTGTWMLGQVSAYAGGDLTISVGAGMLAGSGTHSDWTIAISGPQGPEGPAGVASPGEIWGITLSML